MKVNLLLVVSALTLIVGSVGLIRLEFFKKDIYISEHTHWYGTVTAVDNCYTSKYHLTCDVSVKERDQPYELTITDFPGSIVGIGDRIGYVHKVYNTGYEIWNQKNNRIINIGVCPNWMACRATCTIK